MNPAGKEEPKVSTTGTELPPKPDQIVVQMGGACPLGGPQDDWGNPIWVDETGFKSRGELLGRVDVLFKNGYRFAGCLMPQWGQQMTFWTLKGR